MLFCKIQNRTAACSQLQPFRARHQLIMRQFLIHRRFVILGITVSSYSWSSDFLRKTFTFVTIITAAAAIAAITNQ